MSSGPRSEKEIKFHNASSFPNPEPLLIDPFFPKGSFCLPALHPKYSTWLSACLGHAGCGFFFGLSLGVTLDLEKIIYFAPSLGKPLESKGLFSITRNIHCLSRLKTDKIFERI